MGTKQKKGWKMIIDRKIDIEMSLRQFMVQKWVVAYTHTHIYILEREIKSIELVCSTAIFIRFLATNVANVVLYYWMLINHSDICPIRMVQNKTGKKNYLGIFAYRNILYVKAVSKPRYYWLWLLIITCYYTWINCVIFNRPSTTMVTETGSSRREWQRVLS